MSEPLDHQDFKPDKTWLSSFLLVLGVFSVIAAVLAFLSGGSGFMAGLCSLAIAAVFFALGRALDYLHEAVQRLRRLEDRSGRKSDQT